VSLNITPLEIATPSKTRIGWIGTGVMGHSMCGHLIDAGYQMTINSRTRTKAEPLLDKGAQWADSPREVAAASDIVFMIVGFPADVRQVVLGENGTLAGAQSSSILVDMTTSQPSLAVEIAAQAQEIGAHSIDAPVSGGDIGAKNAALSIMIGGSQEAVAAVMPCFAAMGKTIIHQGPPGAGQHTKMVNQTLVAAGMIGVCESLLYAHKAGLDLPTVLESVASGAAGSWALSNLAPRIIAGDFTAGFYVEHFIKDMQIVLDEASRMELALPGLSLVHQLYTALAAQGHARDGTQALQLALAELSGIDWQNRS
jgi:3-hydroxyisobutyrate dehydrogenase